MAEARLTIALDGEVSLPDFRQTIVHFEFLLKELCTHVDRESEVRWDLVGLEVGSAAATVEGRSLDRSLLAEVTDHYIDIGRRLQRGEALPYPEVIARHAAQLTRVINGRITAVRFLTEEEDVAINQRAAAPGREGRSYSFGEVRGKVETLQRRRRRSFSLYDELFDQKVICRLCYFQDELGNKQLAPDTEEILDFFWKDRSIMRFVDVIDKIAEDARRLKRMIYAQGDTLTMPDAIHLATASYIGVSEMHSYDASGHLRFDGKMTFRIRHPRVPPGVQGRLL